MKGVKEIKARLKAVGNIKKVTSTMELVAAAKMRKLQERALSSRPYSQAIKDMVGQVGKHVKVDVSRLLLEQEPVQRECLLVIAGDKGLCGAFNSNIFRAAIGHIRANQEKGIETAVYAFGKRTEKFFTKIGAGITGVLDEPVEKLDYRRVSVTMQGLVQDFLNGKFQRISVLYSWFKSVASFIPKVEPLLPIPRAQASDAELKEVEAALDYIMEPSPDVILARLLPKSLEMKLYAAVLESLASEFAARRMAMKNATDAASDMTVELTMEYNKARQSGITAELLEIVAGAEALAGS